MQVRPPNRLRELREANGLELYDIAALVRRSEAMISRYETGVTQVPDDVKRALVDRYSVSIEHLMGWDRAAVEPSEATPAEAAA